MTLSALGVAAVYIGSDSVGPFTLQDGGANPILFEDDAEILAQRGDLTGEYGSPTTLVITTDYTLTGAGLDTAGSLTLVAPLATTQTLLIRRVTPRTQETDLQFGGNLSLENLEEQLDKQVRLLQEVHEFTRFAPRFSFTETALKDSSVRIFPEPVASKVLAWNDDATRLENVDPFNTIISDDGAPSSDLGNAGDFYLDTANLRLYGPKTGGLWGSGTSLVGPQGEQGEQGIQGIQGIQGEQGEPGDLSQAEADLLYQPLDSDLTTWAGLTPSANHQTLVTQTFAQMRASLDLEAGVDFYSIAAADTAFLTPAEGNAAYQPLDSDLTSWAAITRAAGFDTFVATPSSANLATLVTGETGSGALVFGTSPNLTTPLLGTPTSGTLTNCTGLPTAGLVDDAVTYAKIQNVSASDRLLGRVSASAGNIEEIEISDFVQTLLNDADAATALATLTALGQGRQTIWVPASAMLSATTSGPASAQFETSTNDINFRVLDFDATADEHAHFNIAFPKSWNEGTVTFQVWWTTTATDTDGVAWGLQAIALSDNEASDTAFGTPIVVTDDAQSAAGEILITAESAAVTIGGTPAEGDVCFFRIFRDVSDGNDDMTEDARLIGVKVFFTTNAATDA